MTSPFPVLSSQGDKMSVAATGDICIPKSDKIWIAVFVFSFLGLMVDGADLMFLSYSLSSIKKDFGLTNVEAGMLGSVTLVGMAIGGIYGGWASDRFGRCARWSGPSWCFHSAP